MNVALKKYLSHPEFHPTPAYSSDVTLYVTSENPTYTIEDALQDTAKLRKMHPEQSVTIRVAAGEYRTNGIVITREMGGTETAPVVIVSEHGENGERAVINGGISMKPEDFQPVPTDIRERFHGDAKDEVVCADLKKYGLTANDWGEIGVFGGFHTAGKYDDAAVGVTAEVFFNHKRMTLARYPDKGSYSRLEAVADVGDCFEFPPQTYFYDWNERRNHRGGSYVLNKSDIARVESWKSWDDVWAFGYFYWDWADSSTPVSFDTAHRRMFPKFVSRYGAKAGAEFYLFNILEELDTPGEYYLDRKTGVLYLYPDGDMKNACVEMSISQKPAITIENAEFITIDGFAVCNTRDNGIMASGSSLTIRDCLVTNTAANGIVINGSRNMVESCEISHTGRGGILLDGGERATLTPGNSAIVNCYIHNFAEIYQTYAGGIHLNGVGNKAAHNEISFTPHTALFYGGNNQLIEYNYIHDVVLHSKDAGAVYSGLDWAARGSVLRYNVLERVGSDELKPQGIYWDDGLSGQTAYGNVLIDVGDNAFQFGGGAHGNITHNLIINAGTPLEYDDRYRDGLLHAGWAREAVCRKDSRCWMSLAAYPIHSKVWEDRYPEFRTIREDLENRESWDFPEFPINPSGSVISGNISLQKRPTENRISESSIKYSKVENNPQYTSSDKIGFVNAADGDYRLTKEAPVRSIIPDFPDIPYRDIGRY